MSGIFGQLMGNVMAGEPAPQADGLHSVLQQIVGGGTGGAGGVGGLVSAFETAGLGQQVQSWIGSGSNMPVAVQELARVFPPEQIEAWAQQAGTSPDGLLGSLAHILPHAVDHATPEGAVPADPASAPGPDLASLVGGFLSRL